MEYHHLQRAAHSDEQPLRGSQLYIFRGVVVLRELSGGTLTLLFSKHNTVHTYLAMYLYKQYETVPCPTAFFKLRVPGYSRCDV